MQTKPVAVGDSFLNVAVEGSGHPILLVHGFPLDHSMWRFQFAELVKQHRVICPDLAGFGASPANKKPMSMKSFADRSGRVAHGIGNKSAGRVLRAVDGRLYRLAVLEVSPEKLSHLIACDTRAAGDRPEVARVRKIAAQTVRTSGTQPVADVMLEKLFYRYDDPAKKPITEPVHQVMRQTDPELIAGGQLAMADRPDATSWLKEIEIPVLFVVGEHDTITPPDEMRANAGLVAGFRISRNQPGRSSGSPGERRRIQPRPAGVSGAKGAHACTFRTPIH